MIEAEAIKKRCCSGAAAHPQHDGACAASGCMAWLWHPLKADGDFANAIIKAAIDIKDTTENKMKATKHVIANRATYGLPTKPFDGYCGLAGAE